MPLSPFARAAAANALPIAFLGLHTGYSPTGLLEVTGGSPAYARQPATFVMDTVTKILAGAVTFDIPAVTLSWISAWDASGNFLGMSPNSGGLPVSFQVDDVSTDVLKSAGHGLADGQQVVILSGSGHFPTGSGVAEGASVYVTNPTDDTLQLTATFAGPPIDFTQTGDAYLQRIFPTAFAVQSTFVVETFNVLVFPTF